MTTTGEATSFEETEGRRNLGPRYKRPVKPEPKSDYKVNDRVRVRSGSTGRIIGVNSQKTAVVVRLDPPQENAGTFTICFDQVKPLDD